MRILRAAAFWASVVVALALVACSRGSLPTLPGLPSMSSGAPGARSAGALEPLLKCDAGCLRYPKPWTGPTAPPYALPPWYTLPPVNVYVYSGPNIYKIAPGGEKTTVASGFSFLHGELAVDPLGNFWFEFVQDGPPITDAVSKNDQTTISSGWTGPVWSVAADVASNAYVVGQNCPNSCSYNPIISDLVKIAPNGSQTTLVQDTYDFGGPSLMSVGVDAAENVYYGEFEGLETSSKLFELAPHKPASLLLSASNWLEFYTLASDPAGDVYFCCTTSLSIEMLGTDRMVYNIFGPSSSVSNNDRGLTVGGGNLYFTPNESGPPYSIDTVAPNGDIVPFASGFDYLEGIAVSPACVDYSRSIVRAVSGHPEVSAKAAHFGINLAVFVAAIAATETGDSTKADNGKDIYQKGGPILGKDGPLKGLCVALCGVGLMQIDLECKLIDHKVHCNNEGYKGGLNVAANLDWAITHSIEDGFNSVTKHYPSDTPDQAVTDVADYYNGGYLGEKCPLGCEIGKKKYNGTTPSRWDPTDKVQDYGVTVDYHYQRLMHDRNVCPNGGWDDTSQPD